MHRTYSDSDIDQERRYRLTERLAILCGSGLPTPSQLDIANMEADQAIAALKTLPTVRPERPDADNGATEQSQTN